MIDRLKSVYILVPVSLIILYSTVEVTYTPRNVEDQGHPFQDSRSRQILQERVSLDLENTRSRQRLPDVVIMGVKKCGTMTLDKFLSYHPSLKVVGERQLYDSSEKYVQNYLKKMPWAFNNETVVAKSRGVWHHVQAIARQRVKVHHKVVPEAKLLMIVRNPMVRYISDLVQQKAMA